MTELETLQTQLDRVRTIIMQVESSGYSEMEIDGRKFSALNLQTLYDREQYLINQISSYSNCEGIGGSTSYVKWGRR